MSAVQQIDWSNFKQTKTAKNNLSKRAKRKLARASREARQNGVITYKPSFDPTLPNRDRFKLKHELSVLNTEIAKLKNRQREIVKDLKEIDRRKREGRLQPVTLYALELQEGFYYVGMTFDVDRRFRQHLSSKGSDWTRLHKPVTIIETRVTTFYDQDEVAHLEDDMTIEYAMKYGSDKVRGGGYCQAKPRWPKIVTENEALTLV